ncbi:DUF4007 family protein [Sutterella wadsworthensis]|uniref:DUF4007 family protein n=2 Tax=Sutterella wadsworthensis TaxID=40545 RepID=UPI0013F64B78|nr:DUF4007 family protein [Sutterella wadsworthensis]MBD8910268.1 DUF4007 family protein [Sutterella wadsworthensis]
MAPFNLPEGPKLQLTGHETFPLRQVWLSKFARYIQECSHKGRALSLSSREAVVELGVGKNMVSSMRFWADASGMVNGATLELSPLGKLIFGNSRSNPLDPNSANISTQWLVHWRLAATPEPFIPIFYLFNLVSAPTLDRESFLTGLVEFCRSCGNKTAQPTIKRAIEVCLRSYVPRMSGRGTVEDFIEPLLGELDLLDAQTREVFSFHRGTHPTLNDALFAFALMEYWERLPYKTASLDFSRIAFDFGSPGKVFKLDTESLNDRLVRLANLTHEALIWTEQAGLKQIVKRGKALSDPEGFKLELLKLAYA